MLDCFFTLTSFKNNLIVITFRKPSSISINHILFLVYIFVNTHLRYVMITKTLYVIDMIKTLKIFKISTKKAYPNQSQILHSCSSEGDEDEEPAIKAQRERERRQANNARERYSTYH